MFYPLELVCKVEYCRTERQDGVMVVGLRISEVDVRVSLYSGRGVECTIVDPSFSLSESPFSHTHVCAVYQTSPVRAL